MCGRWNRDYRQNCRSTWRRNSLTSSPTTSPSGVNCLHCLYWPLISSYLGNSHCALQSFCFPSTCSDFWRKLGLESSVIVLHLWREQDDQESNIGFVFSSVFCFREWKRGSPVCETVKAARTAGEWAQQSRVSGWEEQREWHPAAATNLLLPLCESVRRVVSLWEFGAIFGTQGSFLGVGSSDLWADLPSRLFGTWLAWSQSWIFGSLGSPDLQVDSSGVGSPWSQSQLFGNRLALVSESALSVCSFWVSPLCRLFRLQILLSLNWFSDSVHYNSPVIQSSLSWWERRTEPVLYGSPLSNPLSDSSHGDPTNPSPSNWLGLLLCVGLEIVRSCDTVDFVLKTRNGQMSCCCTLIGTTGMHAAPADPRPRPPTQSTERTGQEEDRILWGQMWDWNSED